MGLAEVPLNFTAVAPVNAEPVMVTAVPAEPEVGENEVTTGAPSTVKTLVLVPVPAGVVTLTNDVEAPEGTVVLTCESETTVKLDATTDPKATEVAPVNPEPLMVTAVPTGPLVGEKEETTGAEVVAETLKEVELVALP